MDESGTRSQQLITVKGTSTPASQASLGPMTPRLNMLTHLLGTQEAAMDVP